MFTNTYFPNNYFPQVYFPDQTPGGPIIPGAVDVRKQQRSDGRGITVPVHWTRWDVSSGIFTPPFDTKFCVVTGPDPAPILKFATKLGGNEVAIPLLKNEIHRIGNVALARKVGTTATEVWFGA